jgi:hypothetical protein
VTGDGAWETSAIFLPTATCERATCMISGGQVQCSAAQRREAAHPQALVHLLGLPQRRPIPCTIRTAHPSCTPIPPCKTRRIYRVYTSQGGASACHAIHTPPCTTRHTHRRCTSQAGSLHGTARQGPISHPTPPSRGPGSGSAWRQRCLPSTPRCTSIPPQPL